ncbi:TrbC/VirB2 family protein [Candidatus Saccharibacteria bacterium]|nr:TrbC/VirB2 family protein [Candidatus Saccharibacteria bacterium]
MKRLKLIIVGLAVVLSIGLMCAPTPTYAVDCTKDPTANGCPCGDKLADGVTDNPAKKNSATCEDLTGQSGERVTSIFQNIVNVLLFGAGIIAVIVIIVSGIRFVTSRGDSNAVTKARQSLIYSVAGLVITVAAFAIVNFVFSRLGTSDGGGGNGNSGAERF